MKIQNYNLGHKIVSLAKKNETFEYMKIKKYQFVFWKQLKLYFFPDDISVLLTSEEALFFEKIPENSIIEFMDNNVKLDINAQSSENTILITNKCNSNCIMCPISECQRKISGIENIRNLIRICSQIPQNIAHMTITGGEPFLLGKDIFYLFQYLRDNLPQIDYLLLTNGRIFANEDYLNDFIMTMPKKMTVGIPIHGYNEKTHDYITRTRKSFYQTINGIKRLIYKNVQVELRIVVSKINYKYLDKIARFICSELNGVYRVNFIGLEMLGNARLNLEQVWISYRKSFMYLKVPIDILMSNGIDVGIYNYPLCCVEKGYWGICSKSISDYKIKFANECAECEVKDACGGMFSGTYDLMKRDIRKI